MLASKSNGTSVGIVDTRVGEGEGEGGLLVTFAAGCGDSSLGVGAGTEHPVKNNTALARAAAPTRCVVRFMAGSYAYSALFAMSRLNRRGGSRLMSDTRTN